MYCIVVSFIYLLSSCAIENVKGATSSAIPVMLHDCYKSDYTAFSKAPFTIPLLVELIRKIELDNANALNMRILATSILHGVMFDGIRRWQGGGDLIPFRAVGEEFYKYRLLVDFLTSGDSSLFPSDALTTSEFCFLHMMLSNTVDLRKRGDESKTCVHQSNMPFELDAMEENDQISRCPIKKGNLYTKSGSVSAGRIIAAVASELQRSTATFARIEAAINNATDKNSTVHATITPNTNSVNNVWISTIAGDLASVILRQASNSPEIGTDGFWNDTLLPRTYFLKSTEWDMTETDILAGIDGLAMARHLEDSGDTRLRLSQLIDMYYSERGILNNDEYKATNRYVTLKKLLDEVNLEEQVIYAARLLKGLGSFEILLTDEAIVQMASILVNKFKTIAENVTRTYDTVEGIHGKRTKSPVEVIIIFDGSYDVYTIQQVIHALSEAAQVSHYGSRFGVINGQTGNWMVNVTGEVFQLFNDLLENEWPSTTLSLGRSLESVIYYYQNKITADCKLEVTKPLGRSILILSSNGRLTDNDLQSSLRSLNSIKNSNPEASIVLVTSPDGKRNFEELTSSFRDNDYVLTPSENIHSLVKDISDTLSTIPGDIINFYCSESQVRLQDYITPRVDTYYKIRKEYIQEAHITTKFSSSSNGGMSICVLYNSDKVCKDVNGEISFDSTDLCAEEFACDLEFQVSLNESKVNCFDKSCRYPDQVRLDITWQRSSGYVPQILYASQALISVLILMLW